MRASPHLLLMLTELLSVAVVFLGERVHPYHLAGITLLFAGVSPVSTGGAKEARG